MRKVIRNVCISRIYNFYFGISLIIKMIVIIKIIVYKNEVFEVHIAANTAGIIIAFPLHLFQLFVYKLP